MTQELIENISQSLDDNYLSGSEKKALRLSLSDEKISVRDADVLRAKIFDMVRTKMNTLNMHSVLTWLEDMNKLILKASTQSQQTHESAHFSPGEECLSTILYEISKASQTLEICVFTISDDRIAEKIIACHRRGVSVKIITDNDKSFDRGSDVEKFALAGIPVKMDCTHHHMHHKFALIDKKTLISGSFNWTRSASQYNNENIIVSQSKSLVDSFQKEFRKLWDKMETY